MSGAPPDPGPSRLADPGAARARLLDRAPPAGFRAEAAERLAQPRAQTRRESASAMVFRLGDEWLALPTKQVTEAAAMRPVHSLPHRQAGALAGLANVSGALVPCLRLERVLGIEADPTAPVSRRLLVAGHGAQRIAFVADAVHGVLRYDPATAVTAPARPAYVRQILRWGERTIGLLDPETLWPALERNLA